MSEIQVKIHRSTRKNSQHTERNTVIFSYKKETKTSSGLNSCRDPSDKCIGEKLHNNPKSKAFLIIIIFFLLYSDKQENACTH